MPMSEEEIKRRYPNLKPVKKGEKGRNPLGAGAKDKDWYKIRKLSLEQIKEVSDIILNMNLAELQAVCAKDSKETTLKVMIASIAIKIITKGDMLSFQALLDRLIGKVPQAIKLSGNLNTNVQVNVALPANGRESGKVPNAR